MNGKDAYSSCCYYDMYDIDRFDSNLELSVLFENELQVLFLFFLNAFTRHANFGNTRLVQLIAERIGTTHVSTSCLVLLIWLLKRIMELPSQSGAIA